MSLPIDRISTYLARRGERSSERTQRRGLKQTRVHPIPETFGEDRDRLRVEILGELPEASVEWTGRVVQISNEFGTDVYNIGVEAEDGTPQWQPINLFGAGSDSLSLVWNKTIGSLGTGVLQFNNPGDITSDNLNIYVCDNGNNRIMKFDKNLVHVATFGGPAAGSGATGLSGPNGIHWTNQHGGRLYVSDRQNNRIVWFNSSLVYGGAFALPVNQSPIDVGVSPPFGWVYVVTFTGQVLVYTDTHTLNSTFNSFGTNPGQLHSPVSIDVDTNDKVWTAESAGFEGSGGQRIQRWNYLMGWEASYGEVGNGEGQFENPQGVYIEKSAKGGNLLDSDYVWVADHDLARLSRFNLDGSFAGMFGQYGIKTNDLQTPVAVCVANDAVYVVDNEKHTIRKFLYGSSELGLVNWKQPAGSVALRSAVRFMTPVGIHGMSVTVADNTVDDEANVMIGYTPSFQTREQSSNCAAGGGTLATGTNCSQTCECNANEAVVSVTCSMAGATGIVKRSTMTANGGSCAVRNNDASVQQVTAQCRCVRLS